MPRTPTKVTLAEVAAAAGVSVATASKALNDREDTSAKTRSRVLDSAEKLGYRRRPQKAPRNQGARVWLVLDEITNTYAAGLLEGLIERAGALDADVTVHRRLTGERRGRRPSPGEPEWVPLAVARGAQALVMVAVPVTERHQRVCADLDVTLIAVDPAERPPVSTMTIAATNWRGGVQATEHLLGLGHRRIAYLGAAPGSVAGQDRAAGYRSALARAGIAVDEQLIVPGSFRGEDGQASAQLLRSTNRPTAIFAGCDAVAFGVLEAARELGLRVPEDLSVVGFDDGFGAKWASPALTSVRQPLAEMGALAVQMAVTRIADPEATLPPVELATQLMVRDTTAPPRSTA